MKVIMRIIDNPYNQYGCGERIQFLIIYNRKKWTQRRGLGEYSIHLNRGLNKLVEYWNYSGKKDPIWKKIIYTPFGDDEK